MAAYYAHNMWQETLRKLLVQGRFRTQSELVKALSTAGYKVTQSSVSRELKNQGVDKVGGRYVLPVNGGLSEAIELHSACYASGHLLVLKTHPAGAPLLAQAIDGAKLPGIAGTIAGDDTVFVATEKHLDRDALRRFLGQHPSTREETV